MQHMIDKSNTGFLNVEDVQRRLGIGRSSAYALVRSKGFPRVHVGSRIIIPENLFTRWVEARAQCTKETQRHG